MPVERAIHIVDDDAAVLRSLERLLHTMGFVPVSYKTPFDLLDAVPELSTGLLLIDVRMPGMDGFQLQSHLSELGCRLPVVVMTGEGDVQTAVRAMKAGAVDFIEKPFDDERLLAAIEAAFARAERSTRDRDAVEAARRIATLSRREREVLDALVAGGVNKVIAIELGISVRTVEVHRAHMLERLGTRRLGEAVRLAVLATLQRG